MRFFWIVDQVKQKYFNVTWEPGAENMADYFTKHFASAHDEQVRKWYIHENNSQQYLPRAAAPKALRGCVGARNDGYTKSGPLPRLHPKRAPLTRAPTAYARTIVPNLSLIT